MKVLCENKESVNAAAIVSACWKNLPPKEKANYHRMAADDKFRYYREKREYENFMAEKKEEEAQQNAQHGNDTAAPFDTTPFPYPAKDPCTADVPPFCQQSIASLVMHLDQSSIAFLIRALR